MFRAILVSLCSLGLLLAANSGFAAAHHAAKNQPIPAKYKTSDGKININLVDAADLVKVKGIGAKRAEAIVAYRKAHGPFKTLDDVTKVKGIGQKLVDKLRAELAAQ